MKPFPLETARLRLDSPVASDRARVIEHCQDPAFERYLTLPWPYTGKDADFFLGKMVPTGWDTDTEYTWALRDRGDSDVSSEANRAASSESNRAASSGANRTASSESNRAASSGANLTALPDSVDAPADLLGVIAFRLSSRSIGFWLGAQYRGAGLVPEAFAAVARWAFDSGIPEIQWECVVGNLASASVARGAGFRFGGEKPSAMAYRDGSHPQSWNGTLVPHNLGIPQDGWPPETGASTGPTSCASTT
jgi:RimJ/RimL family protein N-acetyltransferase